MFQLLVLLGLGVIVYHIFGQTFGGGYKELPKVEEGNLADLTVRDARKGDVVVINGGGDNFEDLTFDVDRRDRYHSKGLEWYDLSGIYQGRRASLRWYDSDAHDLWFDKQKENLVVSDIGLTMADLERFDREQSRMNFATYAGQNWRFDGSREIVLFRDDRGTGERYYHWRFLSPDRKQMLYVDKWVGSPPEIGIIEAVAPEMIRIYRK